jgi:hypothetical protein
MPKEVKEKTYYIPILTYAASVETEWVNSDYFRRRLIEDTKLNLPKDEKTKLLTGADKENYYEWALANLNRFGYLEKLESERTYQITELGKNLLDFSKTTKLEIDKGILERFNPK